MKLALLLSISIALFVSPHIQASNKEEIKTTNAVNEIGISVGGATGFYRISVEFFSVLLAVIIPPLYHVFKAFFSFVLFPIKWLDIFVNLSSQKNRIPGGYYIVAKKPAE